MVAGKGSNPSSTFDNASIKTALHDIKNTSEKLHHNARNILNWIKYQNKRIEVNKSHIAISALAEEVADSLKELADAVNTKIINDISPEDIIKSDKNIVSIILHNLISNAIKFTANGTITLESSSDANNYIISIRDSGGGINKNSFSRIQDILAGKNIPASNPSADAGGTGLGYIIISELIALLPGKLYVETESGKGTTVNIYLQS
jgi:K+-sensing histidine kinase KdpD